MEVGVEELCECLMVIELENEELILDQSSMEEVVNKGENCLLAKLLYTNYYNKKAFQTTMSKVWRISTPIKFHNMGGGLMMVEFEYKQDKN